jgi:hypothetical protein
MTKEMAETIAEGLRESGMEFDDIQDLIGGLTEAIDAPIDDERCPGCGCQPGDGYTIGCFDPRGCGFYLEAFALANGFYLRTT